MSTPLADVESAQQIFAHAYTLQPKVYNELYELDPPMRVSLKLYEAWNMDSLTVTAGFFVQLTDFRHYLYWQNRGWGTPVGK